MLSIRRAGILILIVALAVTLGAASAGAKKKHKKKKGKRWDSTVTLSHPSATQFTGLVGSKLDACRGSRVITLYYTDPFTSQTQPLSVQRTDGNGAFQVNLTRPAFTGGYQVVVDEGTVAAMKATQTCKGTTSAPITV
jgi:hypothetical protein